MEPAAKLGQMLVGLVALLAIVAIQLVLAGRVRGRHEDRIVALIFLAPALLGLAVAVVYPAVRTIYASFLDANGDQFVGGANYARILGSPDQLAVLRNTAVWVIGSPLLATAIGLVYAVVIDRSRFEAAAKSLIFLPMAISFVGASIIWKFVYEYRLDQEGVNQIGLLNQLVVLFGGEPQQWLIDRPWNTLFLMVVMVWIQTGFAMTILSAGIKAIPVEITEAARVDGATGRQVFRFVTAPMLRATLVVVLTSLAIWTLKVFDIVRTMTGGQFETSVVANEYYTQSFRVGNQGIGAALATLLLVLVLPIIAFSVHQMRRAEAFAR